MDKISFEKFVELERMLQPTVKIDGNDVKVVNIKEHELTFNLIKNNCPKVNVSTQKLRFITEWFSKSFFEKGKIDFTKLNSDMFEHLPFDKVEFVIHDPVDGDMDIFCYRSEIAKEIANIDLSDMNCVEFIQILSNKYGRIGAFDIDDMKFRTNSPNDYNFMGVMQLLLVTMIFIRDYREIIHHKDVSETSTRIQNKNGKVKRHKTILIRKVYDIDDKIITYVKHHHKYTKPTKEFGVRGFYRTYKSGKRVWVKPFSKYKNTSETQSQEYSL